MKNEDLQNLNDETMTNVPYESQENQEEIAENLRPIKQLKQEIDNRMIDGIYHSKLFEFLGSKGLEGKALKVKVVLDLSLIREENMIKDQQLKDSLAELPGQEFAITTCWPCNGNLNWCT